MKYLVVAAIWLHLFTKFFWDYGVDYSYRDMLKHGFRTGNIEQVKSAWEGINREEIPAYNQYSLGISTVMLLWVIACQSKKRLSDKMIIILEWWSFWVVSDVIKEVSNIFGVLTWLFDNPTHKYLSEYIIFFVSGAWIIYKVRSISGRNIQS